MTYICTYVVLQASIVHIEWVPPDQVRPNLSRKGSLGLIPRELRGDIRARVMQLSSRRAL